MKTTFKYIYSIVAICIFAFVATSCEDDPHDPDIVLSGDISGLVPENSVYLLATYSISNKHITLDVEPSIYLDMERWGLKVDKVDYYIDNVFCETKKTAPYKFTYTSDNWTTGAHKLRADFTISGEGINTFILPCEKVIDNSTSSVKAADIFIEYNYVGKGDELVMSVGYNPERSSSNTKINSFEASWDGVSFGTKTTSPYQLTKIITDEAGTKHKLVATVRYSQGSVNNSFTLQTSTFEVCGPTTARQMYSISSQYRDYKNGETLKGRAIIYKGYKVTNNYGLELYLDDKLIASSREFPYFHEYKLTGLRLGEHTLKKRWVTYDANWTLLYATTTDETITITE